MKPYADTNFLLRLYLELPESAEADVLSARLRDSQPNAGFPVTWLLRAEATNAFQLQVFVSRQSGQPRVTPEQAAIAFALFREDLAAGEALHELVYPWERIEAQFEELSLRHTARHGFRSYDLLHVASALVLGCDAFWSFDAKACKLAKLEGLRIV